MKFMINNLKYDTDKMELISDKCEWQYASNLRAFYGKNVKLYKSKKGNWLLTYMTDLNIVCGVAMDERRVKPLLLKYDLDVYEKLFGELEEA